MARIGTMPSNRASRDRRKRPVIYLRLRGGSWMEFEDVLAQTIALLQHQGRISYGALKRRFQLDDAYLEDLKVELIEAQHLARDENGRILVWVGETVPTLAALSAPVVSAAQSASQAEVS